MYYFVFPSIIFLVIWMMRNISTKSCYFPIVYEFTYYNAHSFYLQLVCFNLDKEWFSKLIFFWVKCFFGLSFIPIPLCTHLFSLCSALEKSALCLHLGGYTAFSFQHTAFLNRSTNPGYPLVLPHLVRCGVPACWECIFLDTVGSQSLIRPPLL